jgi:hypothetical protein
MKQALFSEPVRRRIADSIAAKEALLNGPGYVEGLTLPTRNTWLRNSPENSCKSAGNSENVLKAMDAATAKGLVTVGLAGRAGGKLLAMVHRFCIPSGDTPRSRSVTS